MQTSAYGSIDSTPFQPPYQHYICKTCSRRWVRTCIALSKRWAMSILLPLLFSYSDLFLCSIGAFPLSPLGVMLSTILAATSTACCLPPNHLTYLLPSWAWRATVMFVFFFFLCILLLHWPLWMETLTEYLIINTPTLMLLSCLLQLCSSATISDSAPNSFYCSFYCLNILLASHYSTT